MTADETALNQALTRVVREERKLEAAAAATGRAARKAEKDRKQAAREAEKAATRATERSRAMRRAVMGWTSAIMGGGGLILALRAVTAELEHHKNLQEQARTTAGSLQQARADVTRNLLGKGPEAAKQAIGEGARIAQTYGIDEKHTQKAMAAALSAAAQDIPKAAAAVEQAAKWLPDRPEELALFAGGMLDLQKLPGVADARTAHGLFGQTAAMSRTVEAQYQSRSIPPALIGMAAQDATPQEASAMFSALTGGAADPTGKVSATGSIGLAQQLAEFLPDVATMGQRIAKLQADPALAREFLEGTPDKEKKAGPPANYFQDLKAYLPKISSNMDRMRYLDEHPEVKSDFVESRRLTAAAAKETDPDKWAGATFEKKMAGPIQNLLLDPASSIAKDYKAALAAMPADLLELGPVADKAIATVRSADPLYAPAAAGRRMEAASSTALTMGTAAMGGTMRHGLTQLLGSTGMSAALSKATLAGYEWDSQMGYKEAMTSGIEILERRQKDLTKTDIRSAPGTAHLGMGSYLPARTVTDLDRERAALLGEVVAALRDLQQGKDADAKEMQAQLAAAVERLAGAAETMDNNAHEQRTPTLGKPDEDR